MGLDKCDGYKAEKERFIDLMSDLIINNLHSLPLDVCSVSLHLEGKCREEQQVALQQVALTDEVLFNKKRESRGSLFFCA